MHVAIEIGGLLLAIIAGGVAIVTLIAAFVEGEAVWLIAVPLLAAVSFFSGWAAFHAFDQDWQSEVKACAVAGHGKPTHVQSEYRSQDVCYIQGTDGQWTATFNW